jgi:hypothetical protein
MGFTERAVAAAGAAVISAVLVNPLDVAKVCAATHHPRAYQLPLRLNRRGPGPHSAVPPFSSAVANLLVLVEKQGHMRYLVLEKKKNT